MVRLESGCTGSFVSAEGLILTNHHCSAECLSDLSTAQRDLISGGFIASGREQELKCPGQQVSVLMATENVTPQVTSAIARVPAAQVAAARNTVLTDLESQCEDAATKAGSPRKCEAVTLYQGGQYWLYKYKRYDDIRLAFAPEAAVAAFGGDPDNFQFPRWCLDMSLIRAYENGRPASTPEHLTINWSGAAAGEPVFVAGHPGTTQRLLTDAQLRTRAGRGTSPSGYSATPNCVDASSSFPRHRPRPSGRQRSISTRSRTRTKSGDAAVPLLDDRQMNQMRPTNAS